MNLGPLIRGLSTAKAGWNQGRDAQREMMLKLALEDRARKRQEALDLAASQNTRADNARQDELLNLQRIGMGGLQGPDGAWSYDPARSPKGMAEKQEREAKAAEAAQQQAAKRAALLAAGVPPEKVDAALLVPGVADNFLFPRPDPIAQATAIHKANRQFDISNPLPSRARGDGSDGNSPVRAAQRERYLNQIADRAIQAADGDVNKAAAALVQQPETANIFSEGLNASHMNAAATRYKMKPYARAAEVLSNRSSGTAPAPASRGVLTDLGAPTAPKGRQPAPSEQQREWDEAAAALRQRGEKNPATVLGPRPAR